MPTSPEATSVVELQRRRRRQALTSQGSAPKVGASCVAGFLADESAARQAPTAQASAADQGSCTPRHEISTERSGLGNLGKLARKYQSAIRRGTADPVSGVRIQQRPAREVLSERLSRQAAIRSTVCASPASVTTGSLSEPAPFDSKRTRASASRVKIEASIGRSAAWLSV